MPTDSPIFVRAGGSGASSGRVSLPRINPLTKFPLSLGVPGSASLHNPSFPQASVAHGLPATANSIVGPISFPKVSAQLTPKSWISTPFAGKSPSATPLSSMLKSGVSKGK